jgi:hypothetical protein
MTASTDAGVQEFNDETGGKHAKTEETVPTPEPQEPDQQGTSTNGGVQPHESGWPSAHILTDPDQQGTDQQDSSSTNGGVQPHDSGWPSAHILTEDEG